MDNDLIKFRLYLQRHGRARNTIQAKVDLLIRLKKYVKPFSQDGVEAYLSALYGQGRSGKYLNTYLDAIRVYQRSRDEELWDIPYFKEKETFRTLLTNEEIKDIIECPPPNNGEKNGKTHRKYSIFFETLAFTGARPKEIATLHLENINFQENIINIKESKIGEFRVVPISPKLRDDLYNYTRGLETSVLFPSSRGGGDGYIDDVDWGYNFNVRLQRLGIKKRGLSVYSLRFSFITRLLSDDVNLFKVQRIVGHHRVEQTAHYTRYVVKDLAKAIERDSLAKDGITPEKITGWIIKFVDGLVAEDKRFTRTVLQEPNGLKIDISYK